MGIIVDYDIKLFKHWCLILLCFLKIVMFLWITMLLSSESESSASVRKNWGMIDTIFGAKARVIAHSIAKIAKANNLKPYECFKYLLSVIPEHLYDTDRSFMDKPLSWSDELPSGCRKPVK